MSSVWWRWKPGQEIWTIIHKHTCSNQNQNSKAKKLITGKSSSARELPPEKWGRVLRKGKHLHSTLLHQPHVKLKLSMKGTWNYGCQSISMIRLDTGTSYKGERHHYLLLVCLFVWLFVSQYVVNEFSLL